MKAKIAMRARKTSAMTAAGASQAMKANKTSAMKAAGASTTNKNGKTKKAVPRKCSYFFFDEQSCMVLQGLKIVQSPRAFWCTGKWLYKRRKQGEPELLRVWTEGNTGMKLRDVSCAVWCLDHRF